MAQKEGQKNLSFDDVNTVPPTVTGHRENGAGLLLETADPSPDSNIQLFADERPPRRVGERV